MHSTVSTVGKWVQYILHNMYGYNCGLFRDGGRFVYFDWRLLPNLTSAHTYIHSDPPLRHHTEAIHTHTYTWHFMLSSLQLYICSYQYISESISLQMAWLTYFMGRAKKNDRWTDGATVKPCIHVCTWLPQKQTTKKHTHAWPIVIYIAIFDK